MPEGDTIFRAARTLHELFAGKEVRAARSPLFDAASLVGRRIESVEPAGKHLMIAFDDGRVLHSHMRMSGSWHVYRPGEAWQKPERGARVVLETADWVAVCFWAPVVRLVRGAEAAQIKGDLGPDVLGADFVPADAAASLRSLGNRPVGEAVMRQFAVAGIGNVYKSELLFLCRVSPFAPVSALDDATLVRLMTEARRLMAANVEGFPRRTRQPGPGGPVWVYGRGGEPCMRCGARVKMRRQGVDGRSTYYCPTCQGVADVE